MRSNEILVALSEVLSHAVDILKYRRCNIAAHDLVVRVRKGPNAFVRSAQSSTEMTGWMLARPASKRAVDSTKC